MIDVEVSSGFVGMVVADWHGASRSTELNC